MAPIDPKNLRMRLTSGFCLILSANEGGRRGCEKIETGSPDGRRMTLAPTYDVIMVGGRLGPDSNQPKG
jgi:hypothetical protein